MAASEDVLVQFRAGLMLKADNKTLKADQRKGLVRLSQTDDGLLHLRWFERVGAAEAKGDAQIDSIIFPGEATFSKVASAGPSSRIYTLAFASDGERSLVFWMQEPKIDGDTQLTEQVNHVLTATAGDADEASEMEQDSDADVVDDAQADAISGIAAGSQSFGVSAAALAQMLSGIGGGQQAAATSQSRAQQPTPSQSQSQQRGAVTAADLASVLRNIGVPGTSGRGSSQGEQQAAAALTQMAKASGPSLAEVLKPEVILPLLQEPGMLEQLAQYLPEEHRNMAGLLATATSSQWRQQLDIFSNALQTGQLDVQAFGLEFLGFSVADFLQSIQKQSDAEADEAHKRDSPK
ncbi:hypothetical protein ABBQ38_013417 [Trebouxia sp. C0009 RCD-2024]